MARRQGGSGESVGAPDAQEFLTAEQVAALFGCSRRRVYEHIREGRLPSTRFGARHYVSRAYIDRLHRVTGGVIATPEGHGLPELAPQLTAEDLRRLLVLAYDDAFRQMREFTAEVEAARVRLREATG